MAIGYNGNIKLIYCPKVFPRGGNEHLCINRDTTEGVGEVVWEGLPQEQLLAELDLEEWVRIPQVDDGGEGRGALGMKKSMYTGKPGV